MNGDSHHLILGELEDFLSGKTVTDTHDERYRQKIARHLVVTLGFNKNDIEAGRELTIQTGGRTADVRIDFLVYQNNRVVMMIKYAPGSLVTRRLSTRALSRLVFDYQIPFAVITNGEDAELISAKTGEVAGQGLSAIPGPEHPMLKKVSDILDKVPRKMADQAAKIVIACEVDGSCMMENR